MRLTANAPTTRSFDVFDAFGAVVRRVRPRTRQRRGRFACLTRLVRSRSNASNDGARRIPAVSAPQNPSRLRSCPVSVCFGPETLGLRPGIVKFRLSPRTNTCGLRAWPAVCHLPPGGCETVSVPKQFRYRNSSGGRNSSGVRNCFGTETVSVPKQPRGAKQLRGAKLFRYRNSFGTETVLRSCGPAVLRSRSPAVLQSCSPAVLHWKGRGCTGRAEGALESIKVHWNQ